MELEVDMLKLYWTMGKEKLLFIRDSLESDHSWNSAVCQPAATVRSQGLLTSALGIIASFTCDWGRPLTKHLRYQAVIAQASARKEKGNNSSELSKCCFLFYLGEHLKKTPSLSLLGKVILYADLTWDNGRHCPLSTCVILFPGDSFRGTRQRLRSMFIKVWYTSNWWHAKWL